MVRVKNEAIMAIINPDGLFSGERLALCSDTAQLHWPRLFTASNTFGRLELSYTYLVAIAYGSFTKKPTESELAGWIKEYSKNFLLFVYSTPDGSTWGQWLTSIEFLSRYHTAADRRSPAPDEKQLEEYRCEYVAKKQRKSLLIKRYSKPHQTISPRTLGIGIGVGIGKEQKPSRAKTARAAKPIKSVEPVDAKKPTKSAIAAGRHAEFKAIIGDYWDSKNPGVQMPWDGREGKQLEMFLRAAPNITATQFRGFLRNRFKSEVNHGERCSMWIQWVTSYAAGPMDRFGKTIHTQGENGNGKSKPGVVKQRLDGTLIALGEALAKRGVDGPWNHSCADSSPVSEPRERGVDRGIPDGLRATEPEILPPER